MRDAKKELEDRRVEFESKVSKYSNCFKWIVSLLNFENTATLQMESTEKEILSRQLAFEQREQALLARESQNSAFVSLQLLHFFLYFAYFFRWLKRQEFSEIQQFHSRSRRKKWQIDWRTIQHWYRMYFQISARWQTWREEEVD